MSKLILRGECQELLDDNGLTGYHVDMPSDWNRNMAIVTECGRTLVTFGSIEFATKNIKHKEIVFAKELLEQFLRKEAKNIKKMHTLENQVVMLQADMQNICTTEYTCDVMDSVQYVQASYKTKGLTVTMISRMKKDKFVKPYFNIEAKEETAAKLLSFKVPKDVPDTLLDILQVAKKLYKVKTALINLRQDLSSCKI